MRQHPNIAKMVFKKHIKRAEVSNYIDVYANRQVGSEMDYQSWRSAFEVEPPLLSEVINHDNDTFKSIHSTHLG